MANIAETFWAQEFWLPKNVSWNDFKSTKDTPYPQMSDLYVVPPVAVTLTFARFIFER